MTLQGILQGDRVAEVELDRLDAVLGDRFERLGGGIRDGDPVIAGLVEHVGDGGADLAGADDEDRVHENLPVLPLEKGKSVQSAMDKPTESRVVFGRLPS